MTPELRFEILGAAHVAFAAQPTLRLQLSAEEVAGGEVLGVTLTAQVMIEPARRAYDDATRSELADLFGAPDRWAATTHPFLWCHASTVVHAFSGATTFGLDLPCTADLEQSAARYAAALPGGELPLTAHLTGRVLYAGEDGGLRAAHLSWETECSHELPVATLRAMIDHHHGDRRFVSVHRDTAEALVRRKADRGALTLDALVGDLLAIEEEARVHDG